MSRRPAATREEWKGDWENSQRRDLRTCCGWASPQPRSAKMRIAGSAPSRRSSSASAFLRANLPVPCEAFSKLHPLRAAGLQVRVLGPHAVFGWVSKDPPAIMILNPWLLPPFPIDICTKRGGFGGALGKVNRPAQIPCPPKWGHRFIEINTTSRRLPRLIHRTD